MGTRANERLTAVVFDRYPLMLEVLTRFLGALHIDVSRSTTSAQQAVELVKAHSPDIFIASVGDGSTNGEATELVRQAAATSTELKVIVLGEGNGDIDEVFAAGASAYVTNGASPDDIAVAIRQTYEPSIHLATARSSAVAAPTAAEEVGLTEREVEVLALVAEGYSNAELARRLCITPQTVKFHLSNIYRKLDVSNRTQASLWAQQAQLEAPDPTLAQTR